MNKYKQMEIAERNGKFMRRDRICRRMTLKQEAAKRNMSAAKLKQMEKGEIPPILAKGTRVKTTDLSPGVGEVVEEQPGGSLVKFDDFPFPNAFFWFKLTPIFKDSDGIFVEE